MLVVRNISKSYGEINALKNFSIKIKKGEVVALIGPNGAGKSTFFKILTGILQKDSGDIEYGVKKNKEISYMPEDPEFREDFTVRETFYLFSFLYGLKNREISEILDELSIIFKLNNTLDSSIKMLSKGNKRCAYFMASISNIKLSKFIVLDEPFDGIDVERRIRIRKYLKNLKNKAILFSSHTLFEVEQIATRVVFIKDGEKFGEYKEFKRGEIEKNFIKMLGGNE